MRHRRPSRRLLCSTNAFIRSTARTPSRALPVAAPVAAPLRFLSQCRLSIRIPRRAAHRLEPQLLLRQQQVVLVALVSLRRLVSTRLLSPVAAALLPPPTLHPTIFRRLAWHHVHSLLTPRLLACRQQQASMVAQVSTPHSITSHPLTLSPSHPLTSHPLTLSPLTLSPLTLTLPLHPQGECARGCVWSSGSRPGDLWYRSLGV
jgi:hypothetical protein